MKWNTVHSRQTFCALHWHSKLIVYYWEWAGECAARQAVENLWNWRRNSYCKNTIITKVLKIKKEKPPSIYLCAVAHDHICTSHRCLWCVYEKTYPKTKNIIKTLWNIYLVAYSHIIPEVIHISISLFEAYSVEWHETVTINKMFLFYVCISCIL